MCMSDFCNQGVEMKTTREIVDALGGTSATARAVGISPQGVSNWLRRQSIPLEYCTILIRAAKKRGSKIKYQDMIR
jgi:hypothetical protein